MAVEGTGATALCWATKRGDGSVVKYLISKGANVEHQDGVGRTAIFSAAASGTLAALKVLVEEGHANVLHRDKYGNTAFAIADASDMWECTLYLYSVGGGSSGVVRSRGYASAMRFARPRLTGVPLPARSSPVASTNIKGDRLVLFGGVGLAAGTYYPNHYVKQSGLGVSHASVRRNDLYVIDFSSRLMSRIQVSELASKKDSDRRKWNATRCSDLLRLDADGLTVTYSAKDTFRPGNIVATRSFKPIGTGYFEITVLNSGINGFISIGLVREGYSVDTHPGWHATSYAYHGDDGRTFFSTGTGCPWGPRFTQGDTVGIGINYDTGEVFFTKNGQFLGVAFYRCPKSAFWPAVGMTSFGESVRANFGETPFLFNFETRALPCNSPRRLLTPHFD